MPWFVTINETKKLKFIVIVLDLLLDDSGGIDT